MTKRLFDIITASIFLLVFSPIFILLAMVILFSSRGGVFFVQERVGKNSQSFNLLKFRTMKVNSESKGQLTVGMKDARITKIGGFLRRYKLDEIPQLINVIAGDMSIVGPRPEVRKYVDLYNHEQLKVLSVKPGLTDLASIEFIRENEILGKSKNPEKTYIKKIMPQKLELNLEYIKNRSFFYDLKLIFRTIGKIIN